MLAEGLRAGCAELTGLSWKRIRHGEDTEDGRGKEEVCIWMESVICEEGNRLLIK